MAWLIDAFLIDFCWLVRYKRAGPLPWRTPRKSGSRYIPHIVDDDGLVEDLVQK